MSLQNRATLKGYFTTGATPTQGQFADLIDSLLSLAASDVGLSAIGSLGSASKIIVVDAGDHNMYYTTVADILAYLNAHDTTDNLTEGSANLYFTNARGRAAVSAGTGLNYNSTTGVFTLNATTSNVAEGSNLYYTDARARAAVSAGTGLSYNSTTGVYSLNTSTTNVSEGTNLYYTDARARAAISAGTGLSYSSSTGAMSLNTSTSNVTEGSNLYYTDARARAAISKSGNQLSYNNSTGVIGMNKAEQTVTDAATVTFDVSAGYNGKVTLGGNRTLAFSNTAAGEYYTLKVIQDGTGSRTLTLPGTCKVIGGGAGAVTLTTTAGAIDILCFYFDGTNYFVTVGLNYN